MTDLLSRVSERAKKSALESPLYDLHPELIGRIPIFRQESGDVPASETGNFQHAARDFGSHVWVHKAVKLIADNVAPLRIDIVQGRGKEAEIVDGHPIAERLALPNGMMSSADLWRQWTIDLLLGGDIGFEVTRRIDSSSGLPLSGTRGFGELFPRQPHHFVVRKGPGGLRYRRVDFYRIDDNEGKPYNVPPEEFIHWYFYNPLNPWRGIAPIHAVRLGIVIDQLAQAWSRLFFKNSARPDYAVLTEHGLTPKEKKELQLELQMEYGGPEGWHKPLVLEQAVKDVKPLSHPPKDIAWLEQRKMARDEVGAIFGVPDEIMGYGRDTYENFPTAFRVLWVVTIDPLLNFRDTGLTNWLRRHGYLEMDEAAVTDRSDVPVLPEDEDGKVARFKDLVNNGVPPNVAAERTDLGLPRLEGGDVGYLPMSLVPSTAVEGEAIPEEEDEEPASDDEGGESEAATSSSRRKWHYGLGAPKFGSDEHKALVKRRRRQRQRPISEMKRKLKRFFQGQENRVARRLRESRDFGRGRYKDGDFKQGDIGGLFDFQDEVNRFREEFGPFVSETVRMFGQAEIGLLGVDTIFDVGRPEVRGEVANILGTVAEKTQQRIWLDLVDLFEEAEAEGVGIGEIQERLHAFYGGVKSDWQTERIARTTMTGAQNAGATEAWAQSEVVGARDWVSALAPGRTRDEHAEAHGQRRGLREAFDVGGELLQYPGDPNGSVGNIVNCLCELAPVLAE